MLSSSFFVTVLIAAILSLFYQILSAVFDFLGNTWQFFKTVFFIIFIAAAIAYILGFIAYMIKNIKNKHIILPSVLCIVSGLMMLGTLFRLWAINEFFLLTILILLETIFAYLLIKSEKISTKSVKIPLALLLGILIFLPPLWTMGYDLNYLVVTQQSNVAYYDCEEIVFLYGDAHPTFDGDGNLIGANVDKKT